MMKKIRMNCTATLDETFADFLLSRRVKGLAEKTLESYSSQWKAVARQALGHGDGHCHAPKGRFGRYDCFHAGRGAFAQQY